MRAGGKEVTRWILLGLCSAAVLSCGSEPQPVEPDPGAYSFEAVRFCHGTHSTSDLERWFAEGQQVMWTVGGFVFFDNDEAVKCLRVGVLNRSAGEQIEAALLRLGVPRDAVIIEFASRPTPS